MSNKDKVTTQFSIQQPCKDFSSILEAQHRAYQPQYLQHGDSPEGVRWNNQETQFLRFERISRYLDGKGESSISIHDVGSGTGAFHEYLLQRGVPHEYSGTELVQEMISCTQAKFPKVSILKRNLLEAPSAEEYDFVVLSGTINYPGGVLEAQWREYVEAVLKKMFSMSRNGIVFNALTSHSTFTDASLFYFDPSAALNFCATNLSRFVAIDHAYALYEYTVAVFKPRYLQRGYDPAIYGKYFRQSSE